MTAAAVTHLSPPRGLAGEIKAEPAPRRYSVERTLSVPAFWRGAASARTELYRADPSPQNGRGLVRAQIIELKVAAGCPLAEIPEIDEWKNAGFIRP